MLNIFYIYKKKNPKRKDKKIFINIYNHGMNKYQSMIILNFIFILSIYGDKILSILNLNFQKSIFSVIQIFCHGSCFYGLINLFYFQNFCSYRVNGIIFENRFFTAPSMDYVLSKHLFSFLREFVQLFRHSISLFEWQFFLLLLKYLFKFSLYVIIRHWGCIFPMLMFLQT